MYYRHLFIFFLSLTSFFAYTHSKLIPQDIKIFSTEETTQEICSKSSNDLLEFYETHNSSYSFDPPKVSEEVEEIIKSALSYDSPEKQIRDYIMGNVFMLIFIIILFVIYVIVGFPFCIIICCKTCKCGIPKYCEGHRKSLMITGLVFTIIGALLTCIGFSKNTSLGNGIFGVGCGVLKMEQHLLNGDEYKNSGIYWYGLKPTVKKLDSISDNIRGTFDKCDNLHIELEKIQNKLDDLNEKINTEKQMKDKKYTNPKPVGEEKITPIFLDKYNQYLDYTSNAINQNIDQKNLKIIEGILSFLSQIKAQNILEPFNNFLLNLEQYSNDIDGSFDGLVNKYKDILDSIDNYSRIVIIVFFSFNLAILLGIIVSMILHYYGKSRFFLCSLWSLMYIFLLLGLVLSGVLLVLGNIFSDLAGGIKIIIRDINTITVKSDNDMVGIIFKFLTRIADTCLNGDGLLLKDKQFIDEGGEEVDVESIDKFSNLNQELVERINSINSISIVSINETQKYFQELSSNPKNNIEELNGALQEITNYIKENKIVEGDIIYNWGILDSDCAQEDNTCYVITKWDKNSVGEYYKDKLNGGEENIQKYYTKVMEFWTNVETDMKKIIQKQEEFYSDVETLKQLQINYINILISTTNPDGKGADSTTFNLNNLLNCGFVKRDVNKVIEEIYSSLGMNMMFTGFLLFFISLFEFIASVFIMLFFAGAYFKAEREDIAKAKGGYTLYDDGSIDNKSYKGVDWLY